MKIQLESWNVIELSLKIPEKEKQKNSNSFSLKTGQQFPDKEKNKFFVKFEIGVDDQQFDLFVKAIFDFRTDDLIDESFKISDFPKINAPAIAFPYLRAYISNLTLQSGYEPIILPSINFVQLTKESEQ